MITWDSLISVDAQSLFLCFGDATDGLKIIVVITLAIIKRAPEPVVCVFMYVYLMN